MSIASRLAVGVVGLGILASIFGAHSSIELYAQEMEARDEAAEKHCVDTALQSRQQLQCRLPSGRTFNTNRFIHSSFG